MVLVALDPDDEARPRRQRCLRRWGWTKGSGASVGPMEVMGRAMMGVLGSRSRLVGRVPLLRRGDTDATFYRGFPEDAPTICRAGSHLGAWRRGTGGRRW